MKRPTADRGIKRRFHSATLYLLLGAALWVSSPLSAQSLQYARHGDSSLPVQMAQMETTGVRPADLPVSGRVVDPTGAAVVGANVSLSFAGNPAALTAITKSDGSFFITVPSAGVFRLAVNAQGFAHYQTSGEIKDGETLTLQDIILTVAEVSTEVQVSGDSNKIAIEQVRAEEKQRVLAVVPNYYVSYNQDTAPLRSKQKFDLAWRFTIDPVSFGIVGIIAGFRQANNTFSSYGPGAAGYGKRYAATYGDFLTGTFISNAILPSLLKQDPRYFYKGTGSKRSRIFYAIANSVICKGDNGRWQANYSNIVGSIASGGISNAYYPAKDRNGVSLTFENAGINIGATAAANLMQEFLLKRLTPHVTKNSTIRP